MTTMNHIMTAEQLLQATDLGPCELVRGELIMMSPGGYHHGVLCARIAAILSSYVDAHALGEVTGAETGFKIGDAPDTVRAPDGAFLGSERVPAAPLPGFYPGPPDLAVEVLSPSDRASEVLAKVQDWLDAGCRVVWVVDPHTRTVSVYRSRTEVVVLKASDNLTGGDQLPGFSIPLIEIFGKPQA